MRNAGVLISILLPFLGGILLLGRRKTTERQRRFFCEAVVCLTSVLVWSVLLGGDLEAFLPGELIEEVRNRFKE